ncbi:PREDICTED: uncharacterized protein LOC108377346 [Rhagoletis zephyria]|uniref:uncharacterized protein LOC108377346 n=1 Tax=Rhagoletis zephyria TaxID=28612 RepID=UPI0008117967|nr:PREDICTED: uncharacterized protein LOC108377346 [Rhagoletis zephyria]
MIKTIRVLISSKKFFLEYKSKISVETTYFTDGSFLNGTAAYAVIEQQANGYSYMKVRQSLLTPHAGIFNAELAAIKFAVRHASSKKKHALICSDSLSVVKSLQHDGESRRFLLWIPAHVGIVGNELADEAAKEAIKMPLMMEVPCLSAIIKNFHKVEAANIKNTLWQTSRTFLKTHNAQLKRPHYNENFTRDDCIKIARMRVGVTNFSTRHHFSGGRSPECTQCGTTLTVEHILKDCAISGSHANLEQTLDCSNENTIKFINEALKKHNLLYEV